MAILDDTAKTIGGVYELDASKEIRFDDLELSNIGSTHSKLENRDENETEKTENPSPVETVKVNSFSYTLGDYIDKADWNNSNFSLGIFSFNFSSPAEQFDYYAQHGMTEDFEKALEKVNAHANRALKRGTLSEADYMELQKQERFALEECKEKKYKLWANPSQMTQEEVSYFKKKAVPFSSAKKLEEGELNHLASQMVELHKKSGMAHIPGAESFPPGTPEDVIADIRNEIEAEALEHVKTKLVGMNDFGLHGSLRLAMQGLKNDADINSAISELQKTSHQKNVYDRITNEVLKKHNIALESVAQTTSKVEEEETPVPVEENTEQETQNQETSTPEEKQEGKESDPAESEKQSETNEEIKEESPVETNVPSPEKDPQETDETVSEENEQETSENKAEEILEKAGEAIGTTAVVNAVKNQMDEIKDTASEAEELVVENGTTLVANEEDYDVELTADDIKNAVSEGDIEEYYNSPEFLKQAEEYVDPEDEPLYVVEEDQIKEESMETAGEEEKESLTSLVEDTAAIDVIDEKTIPEEETQETEETSSETETEEIEEETTVNLDEVLEEKEKETTSKVEESQEEPVIDLEDVTAKDHEEEIRIPHVDETADVETEKTVKTEEENSEVNFDEVLSQTEIETPEKTEDIKLADWAKHQVDGYRPVEEDIGRLLEEANTEQEKMAILAVFMSSDEGHGRGESSHGWFVEKNSFGDEYLNNAFHMPTTNRVIENFDKAKEALESGFLTIPLNSSDGIVEWNFDLKECSEAWAREKEERAEREREIASTGRHYVDRRHREEDPSRVTLDNERHFDNEEQQKIEVTTSSEETRETQETEKTQETEETQSSAKERTNEMSEYVATKQQVFTDVSTMPSYTAEGEKISDNPITEVRTHLFQNLQMIIDDKLNDDENDDFTEVEETMLDYLHSQKDVSDLNYVQGAVYKDQETGSETLYNVWQFKYGEKSMEIKVFSNPETNAHDNWDILNTAINKLAAAESRGDLDSVMYPTNLSRKTQGKPEELKKTETEKISEKNAATEKKEITVAAAKPVEQTTSPEKTNFVMKHKFGMKM